MPVSLAEFEEAAQHVSRHAYHTPLLTSRLLSERTGFDIRLKAEMFQKGGSYKVRGPLNKFRHLTAEQRRRGVICSSAGNHAQGVAIAAAVYKMKAVVVMASNATQSKVDATRAYGAEVVQHGTIWDEANEKAKQLCEERGLTYIHPFDDMQLIPGQGTLGLEVFRDFPGVDVAVVPIGGGGLISGVSMALKASNPKIKIIGVESSDGPAMKQSVAAGRVITLDDREIFDAMLWIMSHCKLVVEGAAAAPVAALLHGLIKAPAGSKVVAVLSGGNVNLDQIRNLKWN